MNPEKERRLPPELQLRVIQVGAELPNLGGFIVPASRSLRAREVCTISSSTTDNWKAQPAGGCTALDGSLVERAIGAVADLESLNIKEVLGLDPLLFYEQRLARLIYLNLEWTITFSPPSSPFPSAVPFHIPLLRLAVVHFPQSPPAELVISLLSAVEIAAGLEVVAIQAHATRAHLALRNPPYVLKTPLELKLLRLRFDSNSSLLLLPLIPLLGNCYQLKHIFVNRPHNALFAALPRPIYHLTLFGSPTESPSDFQSVTKLLRADHLSLSKLEKLSYFFSNEPALTSGLVELREVCKARGIEFDCAREEVGDVWL
ncbi:hypothetical protein BCR35DRAFT_334135 [Leucosporidium creatinivorum]|uniref:F-box domain-containing protein n=1 Tax=Leucosporidium creatinivorum TaxID=106004 RepID=A0A1Y2EH56_9BASI|nr:hypothetical protein BCR35DRAFT_334135 [Leucosporidium creatinivorum]